MGRFVWLCNVGLLLVVVPLSMAELVDIQPYHSSIVDRHNEIRREAGASDMRAIDWDAGLAKEAEDWVKYCRYERAPSYMSTCGQNLYYTQKYVRSWSHIDRAINKAVKTWRNEKLLFKYGTDCGSACSYAQVVWADADRVGCGMNRCPVMKAGGYLYHKTLFACFYAPRGAMTSDFPYTPGDACSRCPIGMGCEGGLCVPGVAVQPPLPVTVQRPPVDLIELPERSKVPAQTQVAVSSMCIPVMTTTEVHFLLSVTNRLRSRESYPVVAWSDELEEWAKYVIRCDIEYPGPRTAYTSFGKIGANTPVYQLLYEWGDEGSDTSVPLLAGGCRTPGDAAQCNHNTNLMATTNTRMGCTACMCGEMRQVTCIYDSK